MREIVRTTEHMSHTQGQRCSRSVLTSTFPSPTALAALLLRHARSATRTRGTETRVRRGEDVWPAAQDAACRHSGHPTPHYKEPEEKEGSAADTTADTPE